MLVLTVWYPNLCSIVMLKRETVIMNKENVNNKQFVIMNKENVNNKQLRKRATNFSEAEKIRLIDLVSHYKDIIENKRSDIITSKEKDKYWKMIEEAFNSTSSTEFRTYEVLKSCWDNLKKKTRKFFAEEKMTLYKTGGGPCESRSNTAMERVRDIIKPSVDGLTNVFDSDAMIETNENLSRDNYLHNISNIKKPDFLIQNNSEVSTDIITADESLENSMNAIYEDDIDIIINDDSQNHILDYLKTQRAIQVKRKSYQNVCNIYDDTNNNKNNHGNENVNDINANKDSSSFANNIEKHITKGKANIRKSQQQDKPIITAMQILKNKMSTPLQLKRQLSNNQYDESNNSKLRKKRVDSTNSTMSRFKVLTDSKVELVEFMAEDLKAKSKIEIQILNMQLKKEEVEVELLEKQLLLTNRKLEQIEKSN